MSNTTNGQHWHVRERKNDALKADRVFATRAEAEAHMRERHDALMQDESLTLYSGRWSKQRGQLGSFSFEPPDDVFFYFMYRLNGYACDNPRCLAAAEEDRIERESREQSELRRGTDLLRKRGAA